MAFYCLYIMSTQILVFIIMQYSALLLKNLNGKISENERETQYIKNSSEQYFCSDPLPYKDYCKRVLRKS